jgi:pyridoxal phosphate enzyme (YggS family)
MSSIETNINAVKDRVEAAAIRASRDPDEITLVAVSKLKPASLIREAYDAGHRVFGENYAQELRDKAKELGDLDIRWHFIGGLQRNKAKYVATIASMMETVDSKELAEALDRRAEGRLACLIEVNVAGEESKSGVAPEEVPGLARHILSLPNLDLRGLMAIPPIEEEPEYSRPYFRRLRESLNKVNDSLKLNEPLAELSMGMSHDFEVAIEEGATIVRVGTAIFGER